MCPPPPDEPPSISELRDEIREIVAKYNALPDEYKTEELSLAVGMLAAAAAFPR